VQAAIGCVEGCHPSGAQRRWSGCWDGHGSISDILTITEESPSSTGSKIRLPTVELNAISCESIGLHA